MVDTNNGVLDDVDGSVLLLTGVTVLFLEVVVGAVDFETVVAVGVADGVVVADLDGDVHM